MKNIIGLLFIIILASFSLNKEDSKKIEKAKKIIIKSNNYLEAKNILLTISTEGLTEEDYLNFASVVFDSCKDYEKAIASYSALFNNHPEKLELKSRISELTNLEKERLEKERIRLERIKACTKCNGTDKIKTIVSCDLCYGKGEAQITCTKCRGNGRVKCENCNGSGSFKRDDGSIIADPSCNGMGSLPCPDLCNKGLVLGICKTCRGKGTIEKYIKCDMHE